MKCTDPGHRYTLEGDNDLTFLKKEHRPIAEVLANRLRDRDIQVEPPDATILITSAGTTNEEVLEVLLDRTRYLNDRFPCEENQLAIDGMQQALDAFNARTAKRQAQGVEGKLVAHA